MADKQKQSAKGNPASKRMMNANRKAKRARSWAKNAKAKDVRIADNKAAQARNDEYRARGELTPYEARQRARVS